MDDAKRTTTTTAAATIESALSGELSDEARLALASPIQSSGVGEMLPMSAGGEMAVSASAHTDNGPPGDLEICKAIGKAEKAQSTSNVQPVPIERTTTTTTDGDAGKQQISTSTGKPADVGPVAPQCSLPPLVARKSLPPIPASLNEPSPCTVAGTTRAVEERIPAPMRSEPTSAIPKANALPAVKTTAVPPAEVPEKPAKPSEPKKLPIKSEPKSTVSESAVIATGADPPPKPSEKQAVEPPAKLPPTQANFSDPKKLPTPIKSEPKSTNPDAKSAVIATGADLTRKQPEKQAAEPPAKLQEKYSMPSDPKKLPAPIKSEPKSTVADAKSAVIATRADPPAKLPEKQAAEPPAKLPEKQAMPSDPKRLPTPIKSEPKSTIPDAKSTVTATGAVPPTKPPPETQPKSLPDRKSALSPPTHATEAKPSPRIVASPPKAPAEKILSRQDTFDTKRPPPKAKGDGITQYASPDTTTTITSKRSKKHGASDVASPRSEKGGKAALVSSGGGSSRRSSLARKDAHNGDHDSGAETASPNSAESNSSKDDDTPAVAPVPPNAGKKLLAAGNRADWLGVDSILRQLERAAHTTQHKAVVAAVNSALDESGLTPLMMAVRDNKLHYADRIADLDADLNQTAKVSDIIFYFIYFLFFTDIPVVGQIRWLKFIAYSIRSIS